MKRSCRAPTPPLIDRPLRLLLAGIVRWLQPMLAPVCSPAAQMLTRPAAPVQGRKIRTGNCQEQARLGPEANSMEWRWRGPITPCGVMQLPIRWKGLRAVGSNVNGHGLKCKKGRSLCVCLLEMIKLSWCRKYDLFSCSNKFALLSTFPIFHAYQTKEWVSPPLLKP